MRDITADWKCSLITTALRRIKYMSTKASKKVAANALNNDLVSCSPATLPRSSSPNRAGRNSRRKGKRALEQLLWGDYVGVRGPSKDGWVRVRTRHVREGWVRESEIRKDRLLEVIFVDIGQGDGCLVVTPGDKHILIDAGQGDNFSKVPPLALPQVRQGTCIRKHCRSPTPTPTTTRASRSYSGPVAPTSKSAPSTTTASSSAMRRRNRIRSGRAPRTAA